LDARVIKVRPYADKCVSMGIGGREYILNDKTAKDLSRALQDARDGVGHEWLWDTD
jgi:hypothetical protein